jgi:murein DD-endopeptidase MepM/ murein hydrolase activator NlpD
MWTLGKYLHPLGTDASVGQIPGQISITGVVHKGLDISKGYGSRVRACMSGTVRQAIDGIPDNFGAWWQGDSSFGGYGNHVILDHPDSSWSLYAHFKPHSVTVARGDTVVTGQVLGLEGTSGYSEGSHCHFELRLAWNRYNLLDFRDLLTDDISEVENGLATAQDLINILRTATPAEKKEVLELLKTADKSIFGAGEVTLDSLLHSAFFEPLQRQEAIVRAIEEHTINEHIGGEPD